jgi:probable rRNA maturation factor
MVAVELRGLGAQRGAVPAAGEVRRLCQSAAAAAGVHDGHMAVEFADEERIAALNLRFRAKGSPTDVLSFPIDGAGPLEADVERELGDVVICPAQCSDVRAAIVHGTLHLLGFDHETDGGEMLALQRELLASHAL